MRTRRFGAVGKQKVYELYSNHLKKREADETAKRLRMRGDLARVARREDAARWSVWVRGR